MFFDSSAIMQALAPGVALTSAIFYYGNLQSRMIFTVDTIRRLNAEARELQAQASPVHDSRLQSLQWQVNFLKRRFVGIHNAILIVYTAFASFILTIMALLLKSVLQVEALSVVGIVMFSAGFGCMALATVFSSREIRLSRKTIMEDIESSYQWAPQPVSSHHAVKHVLLSD